MKKIISMILVCVLLVGMLFTLASCGKKLKGTYTDESGMVSYTFKGKKVTVSFMGMEEEGEYKIKGDEIIFIVDGEESEPAPFEKGKDYIKIDGVKLNKK